MADHNFAIGSGSSRDRNEFEEFSSSPPSVEDGGFVHFSYRKKEEQPKRERKISPFDLFTQDGGALASIIGGKPANSNTSRPHERKISRGGGVSLDAFGAIDFDDFEDASSRAPQSSLPYTLIKPTYETLDVLPDNQGSNLIENSTTQIEDNSYAADEALDKVNTQYPLPIKSSPGRKNSLLLDKVTSLDIKGKEFGNENGSSRKRKINSLINPLLSSSDLDTTKHEKLEESSNQTSINSFNENVDTYGLPNIRRSSIFDDKTRSLELRKTDDYSVTKQNDRGDADDNQLFGKTNLFHQDEDTATVSNPIIEPIKPESSGAPILERKISTTIMNFFTGVLDKSATTSSSGSLQDEVDDEGDDQLIRKTSLISVSSSATGSLQEELEDDGDNQLVKKTSLIHQDIDTAKPVRERKISTSILDFVTGILDKPLTGSSVERAQEVKEIAEANMLFRY